MMQYSYITLSLYSKVERLLYISFCDRYDIETEIQFECSIIE